MIHTDEEFKKEALFFLNEKWEYFSLNAQFDIESLALEYVRNSQEFKYKDVVEAGALVICLVQAGYIEYIKKEQNIRYHILTQKGIEFIEEKNNSRNKYTM
jgi:hypothetical protein